MLTEQKFQNIEKALTQFTQMKDEFGTTWIFINGKKYPKNKIISLISLMF